MERKGIKMAKAKTQADLDKEAAEGKFDKLTDDGKKHKQGDVISVEAFGVVIETKF